MCAESIATKTLSTATSSSNLQTKPMKQSEQNSKPEPKWLTMKKQNKSSSGKTAKPLVKQSSSAQKPNEPSRNQKRARWAKQSKPVAKPAVKRGPEKEYISACCSAPATKPPCGQKESVKDPDSGKMKDKPKGLGHFRCSQCRKVAKVTPRKPAAAVIDNPYLTDKQKASIGALPITEVPVAPVQS